jgi:hypothetical protein
MCESDGAKGAFNSCTSGHQETSEAISSVQIPSLDLLRSSLHDLPCSGRPEIWVNHLCHAIELKYFEVVVRCKSQACFIQARNLISQNCTRNHELLHRRYLTHSTESVSFQNSELPFLLVSPSGTQSPIQLSQTVNYVVLMIMKMEQNIREVLCKCLWIDN